MVTLENIKSFADILNKFEVSSPEQLEYLLVKRKEQLEKLKKKYQNNEEYRDKKRETAREYITKNYENEEFRIKQRARCLARYYEKKNNEKINF